MCGRFTLSVPAEVIEQALGAVSSVELSPRYNIAPTQDVAIVRLAEDGSKRVIEMARWGLVPPGSRDLKRGAKMINARQETLFDQPAFKNAARARRCLVPADGFFEWIVDPQDQKKKRRLPFRIRLKDGRVFAMAGVYERWRAPEGTEPPAGADQSGVVETVSVVTTDANAAVAPIHDRMPVILVGEREIELWLDPRLREREDLQPLLRPISADELLIEPVSTRVNDVNNDDPECIAPRAEEPAPAVRQIAFEF